MEDNSFPRGFRSRFGVQSRGKGRVYRLPPRGEAELFSLVAVAISISPPHPSLFFPCLLAALRHHSIGLVSLSPPGLISRTAHATLSSCAMNGYSFCLFLTSPLEEQGAALQSVRSLRVRCEYVFGFPRSYERQSQTQTNKKKRAGTLLWISEVPYFFQPAGPAVINWRPISLYFFPFPFFLVRERLLSAMTSLPSPSRSPPSFLKVPQLDSDGPSRFPSSPRLHLRDSSASSCPSPCVTPSAPCSPISN